ncbi:hypothetical protein P171DRAFT_486213 [Karstenula rhodostoma CBS 690.94]|uniref:Uncharacterized protein n=1 Tax=Karstenula rhodostoma CBS 690.94 TaxID=1392251 RepID=A0A9P4UBN1_9PLEO|nr:hypothetical protein P171DRAFT_486213 [Karstenula rhodostoma CBS 690.94]
MTPLVPIQNVHVKLQLFNEVFIAISQSNTPVQNELELDSPPTEVTLDPQVPRMLILAMAKMVNEYGARHVSAHRIEIVALDHYSLRITIGFDVVVTVLVNVCTCTEYAIYMCAGDLFLKVIFHGIQDWLVHPVVHTFSVPRWAEDARGDVPSRHVRPLFRVGLWDKCQEASRNGT